MHSSLFKELKSYQGHGRKISEALNGGTVKMRSLMKWSSG